MKRGYNIRTVTQLTGLSVHVIRAWERRYAALRPERSGGNQRVYSEKDVQRLRLLAKAVEAGSPIGRIAGLPDRELERIVSETGETDALPPDVEELLCNAFTAVRRLDAAGLEQEIARAATLLGQLAAIEQVFAPLMDRVGRAWHEGRLRIMHEHMATAVLRSFLGSALRTAQTRPSDVCVVVAAPSGQAHELGALACSVTAATVGLRVTYLGANVPAEEILAAVEQTGSRAVVLSIVFPSSLPRVQEQVSTVARHLPAEVRMFVGGPSASLISPVPVSRTLGDLRDQLAELLPGAEQRLAQSKPPN